MQEKLDNYNEFIRKLIGQLKAYQGMIDQNKSDFKKFVENPTAFFVIEPLSSVLDSRCEIEYCFAVEFLDASNDFIDVLGFNITTTRNPPPSGGGSSLLKQLMSNGSQ